VRDDIREHPPHTSDRGHAVAVGHVGHAIEDAVPAEQVLRGTGGDQEDGHGQGGPGGLQGGANGIARGGGPGTAIHIVAGRVQRPVRRPGGGVGHRVRDRALPEPDGRVQLCRRRVAARVRRAQAQRRSQAEHEPVGRVHHGFRIPVGPQDPVPVSDSGGAGVRQVRVPGLGQDDVGYGRGEAPDPGPVRGADHAVVQVRGCVAAVGCPLAGAAAYVAASQPHRTGQDRGV